MKRVHKSILGMCAVCSVLIIFWLKPQNQPIDTTAFHHFSASNMGQVPSHIVNSNEDIASFSSPSQQDTQINCQIRTDTAHQLIVNEQTKNCFEYFLTQLGEKNLNTIKSDFFKFTEVTYQNPLRAQLNELWTRYLRYREQLGQLQSAKTSKDSVNYYREIQQNIQQLRKNIFSNQEMIGLFGQQDLYDQYTVQRMAIMENQQLSAIEKASQINQLFQQLPRDWQENLKQLNQLADLHQLTAEIKAHHGSDAELHQMRVNLVGIEATQRLEDLDIQRNNWQNKVNSYLTERDQIIKSSMPYETQSHAIIQLKNQYFQNPQEKLRLQTFETVHDQGGKLPFTQ